MISILCPSRGRPEQFNRFVSSLVEFAHGDVDFEILLYLDRDDPEKNQYASSSVKVFVGDRIGLGHAYQNLFEHSRFDIVMMGADDIECRTSGWNRKVVDAMPKDLIGVVSFDDQGKVEKNHKREHGHPFIGRKLIELMGYICHPQLNHSCVDNWVVDIAKSVNRFYYLEDVLIEHVHPKYGKGKLDETYLANTIEVKARDGQFYKHTGQSELKATIERVNQHLHDQMVHRV